MRERERETQQVDQKIGVNSAHAFNDGRRTRTDFGHNFPIYLYQQWKTPAHKNARALRFKRVSRCGNVVLKKKKKRHFYLMLIRADLAYPTNTKIGAAWSLVQMSGNTSLGWSQVKVNTTRGKQYRHLDSETKRISNNITKVFFFFLLSDHNH